MQDFSSSCTKTDNCPKPFERFHYVDYEYQSTDYTLIYILCDECRRRSQQKKFYFIKFDLNTVRACFNLFSCFEFGGFSVLDRLVDTQV